MQWGGYAEKARVKAEWLVQPAGGAERPAGNGDRHRRVHRDAGGHRAGTARAEAGRWRVLVTGAAGGVGSVAVSLLAALGYRVRPRPAGRNCAITWRARRRRIGRARRAGREADPAARPRALGRRGRRGRRQHAGDDPDPAQIPRQRRGLRPGRRQRPAGDVIPFLLRGVNLLGIDSVMCPRASGSRHGPGWRATCRSTGWTG